MEFELEKVVYDLKNKDKFPEELKNLWSESGLDMKPPLDVVFGYKYNGKLIGTAGVDKDVIKGVAIDPEFQGENLTSKLITDILEYLSNRGITHTFLFTKPENIEKFENLGFNLIVNTENSALLERGKPDIEDYKKILLKYKSKNQGNKIGAIIVNCNPMTKGHLYLIETAASQVDTLHIFVLEEERSLFPFKVRFELVKKGTAHLKNVFVHPSSKYIISSATFPDYFLKGLDKDRVHAELDITLFGKIIAKVLNINYRFVGEEPYCPVTSKYNELMAKLLPKFGIKFIVIKRKEHDGIPISASFVRKLIKEDKIDQIKEIVPPPTYQFIISPEAKEIIEKIKKSDSRH